MAAGGWWPSALERRIAMRYLRGQRGTRSASLQTTISIGSIAVGVTALIVVLGVMNGLRNDLRDRILVASPHLRVLTYGPEMRFTDWREALPRVRRDPDVLAAAPEVSSQGMVTNSSGYAEGIFVLGVDPGVGTTIVTKIDSAITRGDLKFKVTSPDAQGAVVLGAKLAQRLNVFPGDLVDAASAAGLKQNRSLGIPTIQRWTFEVTGIVETGMYIYDNNYAFLDLTTAQKFAGLDSAVTDIGVRLKNSWLAQSVADRLDTLLGYPHRTETWQHQNSSLFSALELEKLAMGLVIFFIMIVAAFNIVGTLTMVVAFKTREIGILQAMGLPARSIGRIFMAQGAIVGLVGTGIGMVLGVTIAVVVNTTGWVHIDPSIYFIDHLPVQVEPLDVLVVVAASVALGILATIHPARRAAQLVPVEAIRAE